MDNYKEETVKTYNKFSDYFNEKFEEYSLKIESEILEIIKMLPSNAKIIDLGSGTGNHALKFKNNGFDVLCLDISEKMLELCDKKGLRTLKTDFENYNFLTNTFDMIWAYTSLLHIPKSKIDSMLEKIKNSLKPNGIFMISLKKGDGEGLIDFSKGGKRWFSLYTKEEAENILKRNFRIIKFWENKTTNNKVFLDFLCQKK